MIPNVAFAAARTWTAGSCPYDDITRKLTAREIIEILALQFLLSVNVFIDFHEPKKLKLAIDWD